MGKASRNKKTKKLIAALQSGIVARVWKCKPGCEHWDCWNNKPCLLGSYPNECGLGLLDIEDSLELNERIRLYDILH